jgi:hypothetical protein
VARIAVGELPLPRKTIVNDAALPPFLVPFLKTVGRVPRHSQWIISRSGTARFSAFTPALVTAVSLSPWVPRFTVAMRVADLLYIAIPR